MKSQDLNHTVAQVVRIERNPSTDQLYLVFEVTDPLFKLRIQQNWMQDIEVELIGKSLKEIKT